MFCQSTNPFSRWPPLWGAEDEVEEWVEDDRFQSGVHQSLMSLSGHLEEKPPCGRSCCTVTAEATGTGTGTERGDRGGRKELEGVLFPVWFPVSASHMWMHTWHISESVFPWFSLPFLCVTTVKKWWFIQWPCLILLAIQVIFCIFAILATLPHYSSTSLHLSLPASPHRMRLKFWQRAMNSVRLRVHAWPSGEPRLSWRVCPVRCGVWKTLRICPAWGNILRQS